MIDITPPAPLGEDALPIVAWRIKHLSEPGMLGHYPWSYSERATKRAMVFFDEEPLIRLSDAEAQLSTLRAEIYRLQYEQDVWGDELPKSQAREVALRDQVARLERELSDMKIASGNAVNGLVVVVERLEHERDEAQAEVKEIRARWNAAENEFAALKAAPLDVVAVLRLADTYAGWQAAMEANPTKGAMKCRRAAREALRAALTAKE